MSLSESLSTLSGQVPKLGNEEREAGPSFQIFLVRKAGGNFDGMNGMNGILREDFNRKT